MITREELKKELLHRLEIRVKTWSENTEGCSESLVKSELESSNNVMQNIDEATSIVAAKEASHLLYLYASDNMHILYGKGVIKGDKIDNILSSINTPKSTLLATRNTSFWDEYVQKIYEAIGYETLLPTHTEIKGLEYEIEKLRATGANENEIINLEEQLNLKKCALGELPHQWSGGIPTYLSDNVRKACQIDREIIERTISNLSVPKR